MGDRRTAAGRYFARTGGTPAAPGHVGGVLDPAAHTMIDAYAAGYPVEAATYGLPASKGGLSPVAGFTRPVGSRDVNFSTVGNAVKRA